MTERTTAREWAERVRAWREGGQDAAAFAAGKGYSAKLLRWWRSELARRERRKPGVKLARVVPVAPASTSLTVAVGAARIEVRAGFDRGLLRDVLDALGGGR
jgi:hypothetical protein